MVIRLFETSKMFYPPKGRLPADSSRGPIVFTYVLFWVRKSVEALKFLLVIRPFETSRLFYPPKGRLPADSSRGPIVFTYVLFSGRKRILHFQNLHIPSAFLRS